jgi:hypothetical protein
MSNEDLINDIRKHIEDNNMSLIVGAGFSKNIIAVPLKSQSAL